MNALDARKIEHALLISICFLMVIPVLSITRSLDSNTFTSWRWIFSGKGILTAFFLLVPAILGALALSRLSLSSRYGYAFILVLSLASVVPLWTAPETVIDASRYFLQAKSLKESGIFFFFTEWGTAIDAWTDMPLVPFLYGLLFSSFGESRTCIQAFNTLLFASTALLTCRIGTMLWDEETGLNAGILLLGIPYLLMQVPLMLVDVPTMFFLTLSIYAFLSAIRKGCAFRTVAAVLALCCAFFSKYSTWPMLLIIPLISVIFAEREPQKVLTKTALVLFGAGALAGCIMAVRVDFFSAQIELLKTFQWSGLGRWEEGFLSTFLFQTHPFLTGLSLYGIYLAARKKDKRFLVPAWSLIVVVVLQITRIRYMIPLFPLFVLTASYGLNAVRDSNTKKGIALCIAASSLVITYSGYLPFAKNTSLMNLKHAGEYLNTLETSTIAVYGLPQQSSSGSTFATIPLLDYYADKTIFCPQDWPSHPEGAQSRTSSLRFTREMKKPFFYSSPGQVHPPVIVLISDKIPDEIPGKFQGRETKRFDLASDVFKFQTLVAVYEKN
jgi:hypothetical protein